LKNKNYLKENFSYSGGIKRIFIDKNGIYLYDVCRKDDYL